MSTIIAKCSNPDCESPYQDKKYGKGMRVKNQTVKGYRCTNCGKVE